MDGPQDLGGKTNFGPVNPEENEPFFHADWEKRVLGLTLAAGGLGYWSLDEGRHARESLSPIEYYSFSYYQIWFEALTSLLIQYGELTADELVQNKVLQPGARTARRVSKDKMLRTLATGASSERVTDVDARFKVGDQVRTILAHPAGHTRLPAYARHKIGIVEAVRGVHVLPDTNAHGNGEQPEWLYTIAFDGKSLWGSDSEEGLSVSIDAWERYLEHA